MTTEPDAQATPPRLTLLTGRAGAMRDLGEFLAEHGLVVLDLRSGAAPGTRRLVLGRLGGSRPTHAVAVANTPDGVAAVERERRHLEDLQARFGLVMRVTVPSPVEEVEFADLPALVVSAVPGVGVVAEVTPRRGMRAEAAAVQSWLAQAWQQTADEPEAVDLGREALELLRSRSRRVSGMGDTVRAVDRAHSRMRDFRIPRTVSHGCFCREHVTVEGGVVTSVDDWGASDLRGEPLRDLGHWVVCTTGPRLDVVLAARTPLNRALRAFVIAGLAVWDISPAYWRDVLVLAQAELAVQGLRTGGDYAAMELLTTISRGLARGN